MPVFGVTCELDKVDPSTNTNKYYRAYWWANHTVFQWGRIGASPQSQCITHASDEAAYDAFMAKLATKTGRGGYRTVSTQHNFPIPPDVLEAQDSRDFAVIAAEQATSVNPFQVLSLDVDRCRRLAMGDQSQVTEAITMRKSLSDQLAELRTAVLAAEGQVEVIDVLLGAALS